MLVGNVDIVQHDRITGWAADTDAPLVAIEVLVMVDGHEAGRISADLFRQDLHDLGPYGDGRHGFGFMFSEPLSADLDHDLAICFATTGTPLVEASRRLQRPALRQQRGYRKSIATIGATCHNEHPMLRDPYRAAENRHEISAARILPGAIGNAGRWYLLSD